VDAYLENPLISRPPFRHYADFIASQNTATVELFWSNYLKGSTFTPFPHGVQQAAKPSASKYQTLNNLIQIPDDLQNLGILKSTLFKAAWAFILSQYTNVTDVLFGVVLSGRDSPVQDITRIVGPCIQSVPIRAQFEDFEISILQYLIQFQNNITDVIRNSTHSLQNIQSNQEGFAGLRMFHTMVNFRGFSESSTRFIELPFNVEEYSDIDTVSAALVMEADLKKDGIKLSAFFDENVISENETALLLKRMYNVMSFFCKNLSLDINAVNMMDKEENLFLRDGLLGDPYMNQMSSLCLHELFELQASKRPSKIAIQFENSQYITYDQLNRESNQLARHLQSLGVGPEILVPICLDRSIDMIVAILAVLKSGGGVVPLDPSNPIARNAFVIDDTNAFVMITSTKYAALFKNENPNVLIHVMDTESSSTYDSTKLPRSILNPSNICYVLYTVCITST
jgi:non-ribosomal peptide synthetase component F